MMIKRFLAFLAAIALLPWCMKQLGYNEWLPVLEAAIAETKIAETKPDIIPDGSCAIYIELTESMQEYSGEIRLSVFGEDWGKGSTTWPDERLNSILYIMPAGEYQLLLDIPGESDEKSTTWLLADEGWVDLGPDGILPEGVLHAFEAGDVYDLTTDGLP